MAIFVDVTFSLDMVRMARLKLNFKQTGEGTAVMVLFARSSDDFLLPNLLEVLVNVFSCK